MGNRTLSLARRMSVRKPLVVVVLGSTGTGKSKLGIELAQRFNGEIISADSMQVYHGLDIVTNKVTAEEQEMAPHHLINCVDPFSRFTVVDFRNRALPIIERLLHENKTPIIVGGTNYYIESLLWQVLVKPQPPSDLLLYDSDAEADVENEPCGSDQPQKCESMDVQDVFKRKITQKSLDNFPCSVLHKALKEVDPEMANALHPQDKRKVIRSLQVYQQHGQRHSELLRVQRSQGGGSSLGGPLRFPNSVMLWLQCDHEVLHERLDKRVDEMVDRGLVTELLDFHKNYNANRLKENISLYTEGIFQSIGFKEFHEYLILPNEEKASAKGQEILAKAIEDMKLVTRQYARKQRKWVVNRFLRQPKRQLPPVYGLDATNVSNWEADVLDPAVDIVQKLLEDKSPSRKPLPVQEEIDDVLETHYCDICDRIFVGRRIWNIHLASKKHKKVQASMNKRRKLEQACK